MPSFVDNTAEVAVSGDGENLPHSTSEAYHMKYDEELSQLIGWADVGTKEIVNLAVTGHLEKSRFRSVIWQILLGILPHQSYLWVQKLRHLRNHYRSRRDLLMINPHLAPEDDNPLSQDSSSAWNQYFCDKELRATIRKDVVRTSPGDKFFNSDSIQSIMTNILFLYARENHKICYRQGMHEVLAPLLLVLHADQQSLLEAQKTMSIQGPILEVLDHTCLEEDAYWLLDGIMKHLACTYSTPEVSPTSTGVFPCQNTKPVELESEVCSRMRRIREEILDVWDPDLRSHLVELDIPLYFGIRWLRVMFGQEFSKENLLILWDAIFGANDNFGLVNYIVVAMLIVIRNRLLEEDFTGCLELLVHYPADSQVNSIFRLALHMLKPDVYPQPDGIFDPTKAAAVAGSSTISKRIRRFVSRTRKTDSGYSSTHASSRSSSLRFKGSRFEQGDAYLRNYPRHLPRGSNLDSVELLTSLQSKVYLTSLRLEKFQVTIEQHLSSTGAPASVLNAVDGVKEIAEMLAGLGPPQIETAIEATQSPSVSAPSSPDAIIASPLLNPTPAVPNPAAPNPAAPNRTPNPPLAGKSSRNIEMESFTPPIEITTSISNFVLSNPLQNTDGSSDFEPERDVYLHCIYHRHLGEGKIFARIKRPHKLPTISYSCRRVDLVQTLRCCMTNPSVPVRPELLGSGTTRITTGGSSAGLSINAPMSTFCSSQPKIRRK